MPAALGNAAARAGPSRAARAVTSSSKPICSNKHILMGLVYLGMQQTMPLGITWAWMQQTLARGRGIVESQVAGGPRLRGKR